MASNILSGGILAMATSVALWGAATPAPAAEKKPNILFIMGDDVGWFNIGAYLNDFYAREFWRFVMVQDYVGKLAETAVDFPPMQAPATFNLQAIKAKVEEALRNHEGQ